MTAVTCTYSYALDHTGSAKYGLHNLHEIDSEWDNFYLWGLIKPRIWTSVIMSKPDIAETLHPNKE